MFDKRRRAIGICLFFVEDFSGGEDGVNVGECGDKLRASLDREDGVLGRGDDNYERATWPLKLGDASYMARRQGIEMTGNHHGPCGDDLLSSVQLNISSHVRHRRPMVTY